MVSTVQKMDSAPVKAYRIIPITSKKVKRSRKLIATAEEQLIVHTKANGTEVK